MLTLGSTFDSQHPTQYATPFTGLNLRGVDISGKNVSFELLLAPAHVHTIMELTGCQVSA